MTETLAYHDLKRRELTRFLDYIQAYNAIKNDLPGLKKKIPGLKVAILSSFTITGIDKILQVKGLLNDIFVDVYLAPYDQYFSEILNRESGLFSFNPDIVFLFIDVARILGDLYLNPFSVPTNEFKQRMEDITNEMKKYVDILLQRLNKTIVLHNFEVPTHSPLGILDSKNQLGLFEAIEHVNGELRDFVKNKKNAYILDYDRFCSLHGKEHVMDHKMYYLGDIKLDFELFPRLCDEYMNYVRPLMGKIKKCIVLDLDNTLWGGIIGETTQASIKLGPTGEGKPYHDFQKFLLSLFNRGIILAINSKNNHDDAVQMINTHPNMVLKLKHFAALRINWNDKVNNMKEIAEELNIGTDSLVFIDDDKVNCELVASCMPEVHTIRIPEDPSNILKEMMRIDLFNVLQLTDEDLEKGSMYSAQRSRNELKAKFENYTDFLKNLEIKLVIKKGDDAQLPRLAQLTQKTNQFNMTTKRYSESDVESFIKRHDAFVLSVQVIDKFGDSGIVGEIIIIESDDAWNIDTLLLSCRVLGRNVEFKLMEHVMQKARARNIKKIIGHFIPTSKNSVARSFYEQCGFVKIKDDGNTSTYAFDLSRQQPMVVDYITILEH
ncbi:MAG: HAD-IIIC family phosphatase [Candidatus Lokiarchaeota archaeon]|nr:HAD-IIIC family phosphatase [Candidatus Lokiarchaeota archaeon]